MTDCDKIQEILPAYLEGLATPPEWEMVSSHLASCKDCAYAVKVLMKSQKLIANLEEVEPPTWLKTRIMARLEEGVEQEEEKRWDFERLKNMLLYPLKVKIPLQAFAVLLIAVVVAYVYRTIQPEVKLAGQAPKAVATAPAEQHGQTLKTEIRPKIQERAVGDEQPQPPAKTAPEDDEKWPAGVREIFRGSSSTQQPASPPAVKPSREITKDQEVKSAAESEARKGKSPKAFLSGGYSAPSAPASVPDEERSRTEQKTEAEKGRNIASVKQEVLALTVQVDDIKAGSNDVEGVLRDFNVPVSRESREGSSIIRTEAPVQKAKEIVKRLNSVGRLHQKGQLSETVTDKNVSIRIQILQKKP